MMKATSLGWCGAVKKDLACQTFASLSLSVSLSVLQSLMFHSQWSSSSQTTSGGISPVSLHVMSGARMQFLVPKWDFLFFFYFEESRPRAWGFFEKTEWQRDTETQRGESKRERRVNKFPSYLWRFVCLFVGQPSSLHDSRHEDQLSLSLLFPLLFFSSTCIHTSLSLPNSLWSHLTQFKGDLMIHTQSNMHNTNYTLYKYRYINHRVLIMV